MIDFVPMSVRDALDARQLLQLGDGADAHNLVVAVQWFEFEFEYPFRVDRCVSGYGDKMSGEMRGNAPIRH